MNGHLWRQFYLAAHNPVFYEGQPYVDLNLFSKDEYPALKLLNDYSILEILVLAQLILDGENEDPQDRFCSEDVLQEYFENYDCTQKELYKAIETLVDKGWVETFVELADGSLHYKARLRQLSKDGLYTFNKWRHLYRLALYGNQICKN